MDFYKKKQKERPEGFTQEEIIDMIVSGKVVAQVKSVARSGMSRRIKFGCILNNGGILNITLYIHLLYDGYYRYDDSCNGFTVRGCGMDMIFHTLYTALHNYNCEIAKNRNQKYITG